MLELTDLKVRFKTNQGRLDAVNGVSFALDRSETLGLVGESGSGKTVTGDSIIGLLPRYASVFGSVRLGDVELLTASPRLRREIMGERIAMIFQDPVTSLSPTHTVGFQIAELFIKRRAMTRSSAYREAAKLMERVGLSGTNASLRSYPHELSGGMRQRIIIAMAIALKPDFLIADEPTSALDVTIQAQIMELLSDLQSEYGMGIILISHDLAVVAEAADYVAVMYGGRIVEFGACTDVYAQPMHPYTRGLLSSSPRLDREDARLIPIRGRVPSILNRPSGCSFHPRCEFADDLCEDREPPTRKIPTGRLSECHHVERIMETT